MSPPGPGGGGLPPGWSIELDPTARRTDGGRVLIGGSPFRFLRLTPAGAAWLDGVAAGGRLPASRASRRLARRLVDAALAHPVPAPDRGPSPADVAAVIPVRDAADGLRRTLATLGPVGEVVVVDDGSHDAGAVTRAAGGARVLRNDRSVGPGAARQRGWRATGRPFVAFVDDGVEAPDGWLAPLLAHLGDPAVAAVAPRVASSPGRAGPALAAYEAVRSSLDLGPVAAPVRPGSRVPYVPTAALLVRRTALASVGGFDPRMRVGEDVDLVWRL
ncbi:MAG TPA: glycosyltransferase, partial [Acidimicrobiales bacterium]|nr:glycosyltransferase [Acidimicrobiales bacterium]